jgi:hypothetical protein
MKLMMQKWCWVGLILCASGTAWAAADDEDKSASETKQAKADSEDESGSKDDAAKDESGDEEEAAPKTPAKKGAQEKVAAAPKSNTAISIGALVGYGTSPFTRLGVGLRGGLTLGGKEGLYLGVIGTLFTGTSVNESRLTGEAERTRKTLVLGAEAGYDLLATDDVLVRPYLGLGVAMNSDHTCATGTCWDDNGGHLALSPGAQAIYMFGSFYAGADMRYQIIMASSDASALVMSLSLGLRF